MASEQDAIELWNAFAQDPTGTYEQLGRELEQAGYQTGSDPRIDEMYEYVQSQTQGEQAAAEMEQYNAVLDELLSDPALADINRDRFHSFVAATDGDFEQAIAMYREDAARARVEVVESLGLTPEQVAELQRQDAAPAFTSREGERHGYEESAEAKLNRAIEGAVAQSRASRER